MTDIPDIIERVAPAPGATPPRTQPYRAHLAHYHPIKITASWAALVATMQAERTNTAAQDAERDRQRHNRTTYARGTTGGS